MRFIERLLKSFTNAADKLCVSQPALSQGIKCLEKELNCKLFVRGKKLVLTDEGMKLLVHCEKVFAMIKKISLEITDPNFLHRSSLRIGILDSILQHLLSPVIGKFFNKNSNVFISFDKSETKSIEANVINDNLDFGIISRPTFSKKLNEQLLASYTHSLFVSRHITGDLDNLSNDLPLYTLGDWQEKLLRMNTDIFDKVPEIKVISPCNCASVIRQIVSNKLGIAVLPSYLAGNDLRIINEFKSLKMDIYVINKKDRPMPVIAKELITFIISELSNQPN